MYGTGGTLKDGCGSDDKLQLTLMYTGLLTAIAVEMALSTISCASSRFCITYWFCTHQPFHMSVQLPHIHIHIHGWSLRMWLHTRTHTQLQFGAWESSSETWRQWLLSWELKLAIQEIDTWIFDKLSFSNAQSTQERLDKSSVHTFLSFVHKLCWIFAMNKWVQACAQAVTAHTWMVSSNVLMKKKMLFGAWEGISETWPQWLVS